MKKVYRMTLDVVCDEEEIIGVKEQIGEIADVRVRNVTEVGAKKYADTREQMIGACIDYMAKKGYEADDFNVSITPTPNVYLLTAFGTKVAVYNALRREFREVR